MSKLKLLVFKDNKNYLKTLETALADSKNVEIVASCVNATQAYEALGKYSPDLVLVELLMPVVDGAEFIMQCKANANNKALFGALSNMSTEAVARVAESAGASFVIYKANAPLFVAQCVEEIAASPLPAPTEPLKIFRNHADDTDRIIHLYLLSVGIDPKMLGYKYLKTVIRSYTDNYDKHQNLNMSVYPEAAAKFGTTVACVERNIRTAIDKAWLAGNLEAQYRVFGFTVSDERGKPTNKEFISMLSDKVARRIPNLIEFTQLNSNL